MLKTEGVSVVFPEEEGCALHCLVLVKGPFSSPALHLTASTNLDVAVYNLVWLMQVHVKALPLHVCFSAPRVTA